MSHDSGSVLIETGTCSGKATKFPWTYFLPVYGVQSLLEAGLDLRSGCELIAIDAEWWISRSLNSEVSLEVDAKSALEGLREAIVQAENHGLKWRSDKIEATANAALSTITARSVA